MCNHGDMSEEPRRRGRRPVLSLEAVVEATIAILDADGEAGLTFRTLAARLDTGVGSVYHYVSGKDELLDRATNDVLGEVVRTIELPNDPYDALRHLSMCLYESMQTHRWMANYLMRDTGMQPNSMRLFELFGRQVQRLDLTSLQRFDAVSSLISFVVGVGAEMRELPAAMVVEGKTQEDYLREFADAWRALDPVEFAFAHEVAGEFERHYDEDQFRAGVDLFLAGIAAQAG